MMIPIFIGGTGRSGTTILKHVLRCHPQIASIRSELRVIVDPGGALDLYAALTNRWSPYHADYALHTFRRMLVACAPPSRWGAKIARVLLNRMGIALGRYAGLNLGIYFGRAYYLQRVNQLIHQISYHVSRGRWIGSPAYQVPARIFEADYYESTEFAAILAEFFHDLFAHQVKDSHCTHWLDDTPYNILYARELLHIFPNMHLLHIYRDLRDVLASHLHFGWGGDDIVASARRLSNIMRRWFDVRETLPDATYMELGLEAFASSPESCIEQICQFVGLKNVAQLGEGIARVNVDKMHGGRWKFDLPQEKLDIIMSYLTPFLEAYGYEL